MTIFVAIIGRLGKFDTVDEVGEMVETTMVIWYGRKAIFVCSRLRQYLQDTGPLNWRRFTIAKKEKC